MRNVREHKGIIQEEYIYDVKIKMIQSIGKWYIPELKEIQRDISVYLVIETLIM